MSQSLPSISAYRPLLTPKESAWFYGTRYLIFMLSIVGGVCALFDGLYVIFGYMFAFLCPILANCIWQSGLATHSSLRSDSTQPKCRNALIVKPQFFLPILHHIALAIEKVFKIRPDDNVEASLILGEASSFVGSTNKIHMLFGKLQNHIVVALITTCCQVYSIGAYLMSLV